MQKQINEVGSSQQTFYTLLGGDKAGAATIRALVNAFYDTMAADPKALALRALHPADLTQSREKLTLFLTGWTGGPQLYIAQFGHPMLRKRHMPFAIGEVERDQWIYCMVRAMHQLNLGDKLIEQLTVQLYGVADFMRNQ